MTFRSIASSSSGNAYLLESRGAKPLLIEAGIPIKKLREALNFGLSGLAGCLCSHEHMDHVKAVKDLLKMGVECFMSCGTADALQVTDHHRYNPLIADATQHVEQWRIRPFDLKHDAAEPMGFLISHVNEKCLFIPDTAYIKPKFSGITILAAECNHNSDILAENQQRKNAVTSLGRRVRRNHMSLETFIKMLKENDLTGCREIHLLHLSDSNSDEKRMVREVQEATGIPTYACEG